MTNSNHSNHLQFDCGHRIVQLCPLDLLLVVLDVLLLLVLFDLFTILVEPSQLEQSNDDGEGRTGNVQYEAVASWHPVLD